MERILKRKGYDVESSAYLSYPANWTQLFSPASGQAAASLIDSGDRESRDYATALIRGDLGLYRCGFGNRLWSGVASFLFKALGRRALGKIYIANASCTGCGICARSCPAGSIAMRAGRPSWKASCEDCNRCINICPAEAIQVSTVKLALYGAVSVALIVALTPPIMAFMFGPLDAFIRTISHMRPIGKLFEGGFTSRFARYRAPGFAPGDRPDGPRL